MFNHNVETIPRLYKRVRPQAIFERSYGFLSSFAGRTISFFPSSKTTNEEWANRQQRKTIPARFSVFVLLMKQSHSSTGVLMREARLPYASEALLNWRPVPVLVGTRSFPCQDTSAGRSPLRCYPAHAFALISSTRRAMRFAYSRSRSHRYPPVCSLSYLSL